MAQSFSATYAPELEDIGTIAKSLEAFRLTHLSDSTRVSRITCCPSSGCDEEELNQPHEITDLPTVSSSPYYELFFTYKHLVERPTDALPNDANKLRISGASLESLTKRLTIPAAFIFALTRHYMPNGRGVRKIESASSQCFDFWYFLPVRVQVETAGQGVSSDSMQMNPFHKLHLPDVDRAIHRSCIGIFSRVDPVSKRFTFACFDFMHGRWPKVALEPKERIRTVLKRQSQTPDHFGRAYCIHLIYLTSATRWWTNSLNSINEQLIAYEAKLQAELDSGSTTPEAVLTQLNRALHSIAAHLQRYLSELKSLQGIVYDLSKEYQLIYADEVEASAKEPSAIAKENSEHARRGFAQVQSQVDATYDFALELEKKTQNILALLFNRIQISSDRLLVANGEAMQAVLRAMQADANLAQSIASDSYKLSQEMKKDSVAMKTIAIVTMFFLPGATFATLLSMPFFSEDRWMGNATRFWLWVVLSVPSTAACFAFYEMWRRRAQKMARAQREARETQEGIGMARLRSGLPTANGHAC